MCQGKSFVLAHCPTSPTAQRWHPLGFWEGAQRVRPPVQERQGTGAHLSGKQPALPRTGPGSQKRHCFLLNFHSSQHHDTGQTLPFQRELCQGQPPLYPGTPSWPGMDENCRSPPTSSGLLGTVFQDIFKWLLAFKPGHQVASDHRGLDESSEEGTVPGWSLDKVTEPHSGVTFPATSSLAQPKGLPMGVPPQGSPSCQSRALLPHFLCSSATGSQPWRAA